jgi:hypothetical protein
MLVGYFDKGFGICDAQGLWGKFSVDELVNRSDERSDLGIARYGSRESCVKCVSNLTDRVTDSLDRFH